jgi:hypothetical protein
MYGNSLNHLVAPGAFGTVLDPSKKLSNLQRRKVTTIRRTIVISEEKSFGYSQGFITVAARSSTAAS